MADETETPDLKRLMEVVIQKVDGLASDLRTNTYSIDRIEVKVDKLEGRFDNLETRFDHLEHKFDNLETRFDKLQGDVGTIKSDLKILTGQFTSVTRMAMDDNERLDGLEKRVDALEQQPH